MDTATGSRTEERVHELFCYRSDVGAAQYYSATTGKSGYAKICAHQPPWLRTRCEHRKTDTKCGQCPEFAALPITPEIVKLHLDGAATLGAYQLGNDGMSVRWMVVDFDDHGLCSEEELQDAALIARESLSALQMPSYFEASGGTGWRCHLWVFFAGPVAAIKAKVLLDAALRQAELHEKPFIERFPKQSRALNGYGNLVKVPLGIHRKTKKRSQFLDGNLNPVGNVAALEMIEPVDPAVVDFVIDMKKLPLEDSPLASVYAPARKFDYPSDAMNKILTNCWYFREFERRQANPEANTHYEDWWNYVLMFSRFGDAGVNRVLTVSQQDDRFDFEYTVNQVNYIRQHGYHAPSCRRLREGLGFIHCPLDPLECGAQNG